MPSRLRSLGNDRIDPAILEHARFGNRGGAANHENACALDGVDQLRWWQPEMKADDLRLGSQEHGQMLAANLARRASWLRNRPVPLNIVGRLQALIGA